MLLDTTDQQNHARWTGAIYALRDLMSHMQGLLKTEGCTHKSFSEDIALIREIGIQPIIVHGGGPQIGKMLKKKNIETKFVQGLRITDKETVKIVEEVLANEINKEIVNSINETGGKAIGLAGNKDSLIKASKLKVSVRETDSNIEKILDIGFVGEPIKINSEIILDKLLIDDRNFN